MPRKNIPFYKRLFFRLLLPVVVTGLIVTTGMVFYLSAPLKKQLTDQFDANLSLSSMLGLQACEEAFNYLLEIRLEDEPEMNRSMQNEVLDKLMMISGQFPHIQMFALKSGKEILSATNLNLPATYQDQQLIGESNSPLSSKLEGKSIRASVRSFPFWDWHIVSFVYEKDYIAPVKLASRIIYWSAFGVFLAVVGTLLIVYFFIIKSPLKRLVLATKHISKGQLKKIQEIPKSELGLLTESFNTMIDSLEREKGEVRNLITKLQESEAMFRSQFEFGNIGIAITRLSDGQVRTNERLQNLIGYSSDELQNMEWSALTHPDDLQAEIIHFDSMLRGDIDNYQIDKRVFRKDGEQLFTHVSVACDREEDGTIRFLIASILDITERVLAQNERQETNRMLRLVLDNIPVRVFWKDLDSIYQGGNQAFAADAGLTSHENLPGKVDSDLAFKEQAELFRADDAAVMESGHSKLFFEEQQSRANGSIHWLMTNKVPMKDNRGNIVGVLGTYHDITREKQAEDELNKLRNYLSNIIDSMPSLLVAVNREQLVTQWNTTARKQTGLSWQDVQGKELSEVCSLFSGDREIIAQSIRTRQVVTDSDRKVYNIKGTQFYDLTIYPLMANGVEGAVIRLDDVTEKHIMQEQLNHRNKMDAIGQLAGGVAHDFNNMLSGIIGATELLELKLPSDPGTAKLHKMIINSAQRAAGLTQKLLAFARKQHPASSAIDMHKTIQDAVALLDKSLDKRVRIKVTTNAEHDQIVGDPSQLQSIIMNLGINAAHAMPGGGELSITTSTTWLDELYCSASPFDLKAGHYLTLEVRDTGCGIAPEELPHIFEPFYTTKKQGKGTGLGLAAVFGTVQQHQGAISVYSEVDKGTVFRVHFPLTRENALLREPVLEPLHGSGTILIVDDEEVMRITAKTLLENLGYEILVAEDGRKALAIYSKMKQDIDLVILDMIMPEMNGRDCFTELKKMNQKVQVILSSGYSKEADVVEMKKEGLYGFLNKPYRITELSREVARALEDANS